MSIRSFKFKNTLHLVPSAFALSTAAHNESDEVACTLFSPLQHSKDVEVNLRSAQSKVE